MNCGATLKAKFCHVCGQRKQRRVVSLFLLAGEFIQELFDIESRLWRSLWPLFTKPGLLTKSFMEGRREHYLPPVRLYLISSIIFFLLVSMSPRSYIDQVSAAINAQRGDSSSEFEQGLNTDINANTSREFLGILSRINKERNKSSGDDAPATEADGEDGANTNTDDTTASTVTIANREVADIDNPPVVAEPDTDSPESANELSGDSTEDNTDNSDNELTFNIGGDNEDLSEVDLDDFEVSVECDAMRSTHNVGGWNFLREPLYRGCVSVSTWGGLLDFLGELIDGLPKTLFILLPLMALVNKLLYLFAGRYYVEHLLFYVHNYSFLFLFTVLLTGIGKLALLAGIGISGILAPLGIFYTIYYFFKSMRVVYGQGFFFTLIKWILLNFSFFVLVSLVIVFFTLAAAAVHGI